MRLRTKDSRFEFKNPSVLFARHFERRTSPSAWSARARTCRALGLATLHNCSVYIVVSTHFGSSLSTFACVCTDTWVLHKTLAAALNTAFIACDGVVRGQIEAQQRGCSRVSLAADCNSFLAHTHTLRTHTHCVTRRPNPWRCGGEAPPRATTAWFANLWASAMQTSASRHRSVFPRLSLPAKPLFFCCLFS